MQSNGCHIKVTQHSLFTVAGNLVLVVGTLFLQEEFYFYNRNFIPVERYHYYDGSFVPLTGIKPCGMLFIPVTGIQALECEVLL